MSIQVQLGLSPSCSFFCWLPRKCYARLFFESEAHSDPFCDDRLRSFPWRYDSRTLSVSPNDVNVNDLGNTPTHLLLLARLNVGSVFPIFYALTSQVLLLCE